MTSSAGVHVWVDFCSFVASSRRGVIEAGKRTSERRKSRRTRQTVAIAVHRLRISAVGENRGGCDPTYVGGRPWANMMVIVASNGDSKDWASAWSVNSHPATDGEVRGTVNDSGFSPDSENGRQIDVYTLLCVSFCPFCPSSP